MAAPLTFGIESQGTSVRAMGDLAAAAERAGLDAAWAPELYDRSATISVAEMAHRTERCTVGTAIAYGVGRSPLTLAAEARDLDEVSGGRFVLGIGNGTRRMISDWHGQDPEAPAVRIEELVPLLRRIWNLHEEPVDHEGRFYRLRIKPTGDVAPAARAIPIYTAGVNPRMIESAGRVADGLLGHALFTAEHIAEVVRPAIAKGAAHADRDPADIAVASLVISVVDDDADRARAEAAAQIAFYCSAKTYAALLDSHGFVAEGAAIREAFAAGDFAAMVAAVSDEMVDRMALAGTPEEVKAAAKRYEGILDHLILYAPSYGVSPERAEENANGLVAAFGEAS
ncbi:MAG TPA: LLM class flavin-dependent oxidoreductase [Solirubrobacterales bacterium]